MKLHKNRSAITAQKTRAFEPPVYRLFTQERRASFCRTEMRRQGISMQDLCDMTGLHWMTVSRFLDLSGKHQATRNPCTDTTKEIFHALGFDLCFTVKDSVGVVEL